MCVSTFWLLVVEDLVGGAGLLGVWLVVAGLEAVGLEEAEDDADLLLSFDFDFFGTASGISAKVSIFCMASS